MFSPFLVFIPAEDESFVVWEMFDKAASPQDESDQDYYFTDDDWM